MTQRGMSDFFGDFTAPVVATAIHAGHDLRPEIAEQMVLDEEVRLREEDPFTDDMGALCPSRVQVHRSRFEVDLNRARDAAVYRTPEDCWDLDVWQGGALDDALVQGSLEQYDLFYRSLKNTLDPLAARGPFVVFDVHSYNHRRDGADLDEAPHEENPEVNVGTGSLDRDRWGSVVDAFSDTLAGRDTPGGEIDVRENVRFKGAQLCRWIHSTYPETGIGLALEFKKTYMDEWTGEPDRERIEAMAQALAATVDPVTRALATL